MSRLRQLFNHLIIRDLFVFLTILGAVFAVYSPVLNGQFIWDDGYLVGENPFFRSPIFALEVFRHYLYVDSPAIYYRPVQNLSYMIDYWLWRDNPFGFHLSSLFTHALSAFLLFQLLKRILPSLAGAAGFDAPAHNERQDPPIDSSRRPPELVLGIAYCVALVWAIHPIHNAAVAYIAGRADSLIAVFALTAWLLFLKSESASAWISWPLRAMALIFSLLALCSKEAGLLWLLLFLVWAFGFWRPVTLQKRLGLLLALGSVFAVYYWLRHLPGPRPSPDGSADPFLFRLLLMFRAMGDYTGLVFWPAHLQMERMLGQPGPYPDLNSWVRQIRSEYLSVIGLFAFTTMIWGAVNAAPGRKLRVLGAIWFLIGFVPISNLIPLNAQAAEHWIYMPSIGFMLMIAGFILAWPTHRPAVTLFILIATIPLGLRTAVRSADWADSGRLFRQTALAGGGTQRIQVNLANLSTGQGDLVLGERRLRATLQRFPTYVPARINLGINLLKQNKDAEAEALLSFDPESARRAASDFAHSWSAPLNLAQLRIKQNRLPEALSILEEAIGIYPGIWELVADRAKLLQKLQGPQAALPGVQKYVDDRWWHFEATMMLGDLRGANGEGEAAKAAWTKAATLDIHHAQPFIRMARFAITHKEFQEALEAQQKAIAREPLNSTNYLMLAAIYDQLKRPTDSEQAIRQAEALGKADR